VAGSCECGDEVLAFGTMELVTLLGLLTDKEFRINLNHQHLLLQYIRYIYISENLQNNDIRIFITK
jgi:hypothetical protein